MPEWIIIEHIQHTGDAYCFSFFYIISLHRTIEKDFIFPVKSIIAFLTVIIFIIENFLTFISGIADIPVVKLEPQYRA